VTGGGTKKKGKSIRGWLLTNGVLSNVVGEPYANEFLCSPSRGPGPGKSRTTHLRPGVGAKKKSLNISILVGVP